MTGNDAKRNRLWHRASRQCGEAIAFSVETTGLRVFACVGIGRFRL
jgi:hypothetical protein